MKNRIVFLFGVCFLIGCNSTQNVDYLQSDEFSKQNMPFSEAVRVGNMLYLSGQIGSSPEDPSKVVAGGIGPETRQTMEKMKEAMEEMDPQKLLDALENFEFDMEAFEEQLDRFIDMFELALAEQKMDEVIKRLEKMVEEQAAIVEELNSA